VKTTSFGLTDVGRRRSSNEDDFLVEPARGLFAVADGMGGHAAGEVASRLAIESLDASFRDGAIPPGDPLGAAERLRAAVVSANRAIWDAILGHDERRGMGTTLAVVLTLGDQVVVGHVGDSRVYLFRENRLARLTSDHSWVNEQVRMGFLTDEAAQRHPMRNIVTRALGSREDVAVDVALEPFRAGDVILLCSDGLNTMVPDEDIRDLLERHRTDPEAACRSLVDEANRRGGEDNVTVVVVAGSGATGGDPA
jgi:protein phosphatase